VWSSQGKKVLSTSLQEKSKVKGRIVAEKIKQYRDIISSCLETGSSAIAEGPRDALVSTNPTTTKRPI